VSKKRRIKKIRTRRGMATVDDLGDELGCGKGVAYELVHTGAVPASRLGRRYLISWQTIERIKSGAMTITMPCR
jgi:excisionase family DNA binding protein